MIINDILNIREPLIKLNKIKFENFKTVSEIYKLTKQVDSVLDMVQQEQNKIIDMYVMKDEKGKPISKNSQYQFNKDEDRINFISDSNKLRTEEVNDINKINISLSSIKYSPDLSAEDMMKLESVINWVD